MKAEQIIDYLCEVLNINSSNTLIMLDMLEDLKEVQNLAEFRKYIKSRVANLNDEYRYLTGYQKFIKLVDNFNKENKNKLTSEVLEGVELKVNDLIAKCRNIGRIILRDRPNNIPVEKLSYAIIPNYFEVSEVNLLESVGGFHRWLADYDENDFKEELILEVEKARLRFHSKQKAIGTKQDATMITLQDIKDRR